MYTTLGDQLQWEQQVQGMNQTLPADLIDRSQAPVSDALTTEYGFGLEFGGYKGLDYTFHAGSTGGANAYLMRFPGQKTSIIVMGNTTEIGVAQTARKLADIVLSDQIGTAVNKRKPEQVSTPPASASLVGLYETEYADRVTVTETEEGLLASIFGGNPVPLKLEDTNFYAYGDLAHVKLDTIKLSVYAGSSTYEMIKLPTLPDDDEWAKSVSGTFINPETDVQISLKYVGKKAFKISMADDLRDGKALGRDYLAMGSYRVEIVRDEFGDVAALSVDNSRNENIEFLPSGG